MVQEIVLTKSQRRARAAEKILVQLDKLELHELRKAAKEVFKVAGVVLDKKLGLVPSLEHLLGFKSWEQDKPFSRSRWQLPKLIIVAASKYSITPPKLRPHVLSGLLTIFKDDRLLFETVQKFIPHSIDEFKFFREAGVRMPRKWQIRALVYYPGETREYKLRQRMNRVMEQRILVGDQLLISDPCYQSAGDLVDTSGTVLLDVVAGYWSIQFTQEQVPEWGLRVSELALLHTNEPQLGSYESTNQSILVDSGQAGIFDTEMYAAALRHEGFDNLYNRICELTSKSCGRLDDFAVVCSSGIGDGTYPIYVRKNAADKIIAVKIDFSVGWKDDDFDTYDL